MNRLLISSAIAALLLAGSSHAGTFLGFGLNNPNVIIHPGGTFVGGVHEVEICLDPTMLPAPDADPTKSDPEQALRNVVAEYNRLQGINGNVETSNLGGMGYPADFESVAMHEIGHCIGLDHSVLGSSETSSSDTLNYHTNSFKGGNNAFDVNAGTDTVRASRDDLRGDDVNRFWFRKNVNDPFAALPTDIDTGTYSVNLADLPAGHNFPEAATKFDLCVGPTTNTSSLRSKPDSMSVMFPVLCVAQFVRSLSLDDEATLRIGEAGNDQNAGTADDYSIHLTYGGKKSSCDVVVQFRTNVSFGICNAGASGGGTNYSITTGNAGFSYNTTWYFNQTDTTGVAGANTLFANGFE